MLEFVITLIALAAFFGGLVVGRMLTNSELRKKLADCDYERTAMRLDKIHRGRL